jgi:hypothetical protein
MLRYYKKEMKILKLRAIFAVLSSEGRRVLSKVLLPCATFLFAFPENIF